MQINHRIPLSLDSIGIGLSGACIVHCLFLPVLISALPVFESWFAAEWVHQLMVILAVPVTGLAMMNLGQHKYVLAGAMFTGIGLLLAAAFLPALHDYETSLTVSGAIILAGSHLLRWRARKS